ncbi:MAG: RloB domain-containing protein [Sphaerochaetaceae bacterium]
MSNYRLSYNNFDRKEPSRLPKSIIWLSVEGKETEINYFNLLEKYKIEIGINSNIRIETIKRIDTNSDPYSVLELLEECVETRKTTLLDNICDLSNLVKTLGIGKIKQYLDNKTLLTMEERNKIDVALKTANYDIEYQKYIKEAKAEEDIYCIVVDTEGKNNPLRIVLEKVLNECEKRGYKYFLSNPCFEFFLLLHTYNPKKEYKENKNNFINNPKISNKHTYVSKLLSKTNHHQKYVSEVIFKKEYLPNIQNALKNSKEWANTPEEVKLDVGSNMIDFFNLVLNDNNL